MNTFVNFIVKFSKICFSIVFYFLVYLIAIVFFGFFNKFMKFDGSISDFQGAALIATAIVLIIRLYRKSSRNSDIERIAEDIAYSHDEWHTKLDNLDKFISQQPIAKHKDYAKLLKAEIFFNQSQFKLCERQLSQIKDPGVLHQNLLDKLRSKCTVLNHTNNNSKSSPLKEFIIKNKKYTKYKLHLLTLLFFIFPIICYGYYEYIFTIILTVIASCLFICSNLYIHYVISNNIQLSLNYKGIYFYPFCDSDQNPISWSEIDDYSIEEVILSGHPRKRILITLRDSNEFISEMTLLKKLTLKFCKLIISNYYLAIDIHYQNNGITITEAFDIFSNLSVNKNKE